MKHFYAVIIGSEILNGRRIDKHFEFLKNALIEHGHSLYASFIIKDETDLMTSIYRMIKDDPHAVMFSFGGIGATPDDLTREIASKVFTGKVPVRHPAFEQAVLEKYGDQAFPHRIRMSDIPEGAELLHNPVNNMSGFYLQKRYFFVPGFPEMAHAMITEALERFYPAGLMMHRRSLVANISENALIDVMKQIPDNIECSSLPMLKNDLPSVEISVAGTDETSVTDALEQFKVFLTQAEVSFRVLDQERS